MSLKNKKAGCTPRGDPARRLAFRLTNTHNLKYHKTMKKTDIDDLRIRAKAFLEDNAYTISAAARAINISPSALSLFLSDKYTGDNERVAKSLLSWLNRQAERASLNLHDLVFVQTRNARRIFEVCRLCHVEGDIGVVYGPAGLGKTVSAKQYSLQNEAVIYIEVDPSFSARSIIKEIHRKLGGDGKGGIYDLFQDIIARLEGTQRLIIVDQAEILPRKGIELLRAINDKAGVGITLLGMETLRNNIKGNRGEYAQLSSRIGISIRLKDFEDEDIREIVSSAMPGTNGLWKSYAAHTRNGRTLAKLLKRSMTVAGHNDMQVTEEIIRQSKSLLEV